MRTAGTANHHYIQVTAEGSLFLIVIGSPAQVSVEHSPTIGGNDILYVVEAELINILAGCNNPKIIP